MPDWACPQGHVVPLEQQCPFLASSTALQYHHPVARGHWHIIQNDIGCTTFVGRMTCKHTTPLQIHTKASNKAPCPKSSSKTNKKKVSDKFLISGFYFLAVGEYSSLETSFPTRGLPPCARHGAGRTIARWAGSSQGPASPRREGNPVQCPIWVCLFCWVPTQNGWEPSPKWLGGALYEEIHLKASGAKPANAP